MLKKLLKLILYILLLLGISFLFIPPVWWLGAFFVALSIFSLYKLRKKTPEETTTHGYNNTSEEKTIDNNVNKTTPKEHVSIENHKTNNKQHIIISKNNPLPKGVYNFDVIGIKYSNKRITNFKNTNTGDQVKFYHEYDNKHDENAIKVSSDEGFIGYIPKKNNKKLLATINKYPYYYAKSVGKTDYGGVYVLHIEAYLGYSSKEELDQEIGAMLNFDSNNATIEKFKQKVDFSKAKKEYNEALEHVLEWINFVSSVNKNQNKDSFYRFKHPLKELNIICNKLKKYELFIDTFNNVYDETLYTEKQNTDLLLRLEKSKQKTL